MRGKTKLIKIAWLHILGKYLVKVQTLSLLFFCSWRACASLQSFLIAGKGAHGLVATRQRIWPPDVVCVFPGAFPPSAGSLLYAECDFLLPGLFLCCVTTAAAAAGAAHGFFYPLPLGLYNLRGLVQNENVQKLLRMCRRPQWSIKPSRDSPELFQNNWPGKKRLL